MRRSEELTRAIAGRVEERKRELMAMSPAELRGLPEHTPETFVAPGGRSFEMAVWHVRTEQGEDLFAVQCLRTGILGFNRMFADGFVLQADGATREAEDRLLWQFL